MTTPLSRENAYSRENAKLAILRTELSNRRTLLAYLKSSLGIALTGLGLIKFTHTESIFTTLGFVLFPIALIVMLIGIADYLYIRKRIMQEKESENL